MRQVTAAVIIEDGRLFVARRPAGDPLAGLWELPGGKIEDGESPQDCLRRELIEELDMRVEAGEVLASVVYEYAHGAFELLAVSATRVSDYCLRVHDQSAWAPVDDVARWDLAPADIQLLEAIESLLRASA